MNPAGALPDTGPLVALLSRTDANHERAKAPGENGLVS